MAPAAAKAARAKYSKDEKVLCFHMDMLYEAKVMDVAPVPKPGEGFRFKIHYKGWKASWDDWVLVDRIRPFDDEHRQLAAELYANVRQSQQKNAKLPKKALRTGVDSARGSEERSSAAIQGGRGRRGKDWELEQASPPSLSSSIESVSLQPSSYRSPEAQSYFSRPLPGVLQYTKILAAGPEQCFGRRNTWRRSVYMPAEGLVCCALLSYSHGHCAYTPEELQCPSRNAISASFFSLTNASLPHTMSLEFPFHFMHGRPRYCLPSWRKSKRQEKSSVNLTGSARSEEHPIFVLHTLSKHSLHEIRRTHFTANR